MTRALVAHSPVPAVGVRAGTGRAGGNPSRFVRGGVLCPGAGAFEIGGGAQDGGVGALPPGDLQPDGPPVGGKAGRN
jgi:hypothetical protein